MGEKIDPHVSVPDHAVPQEQVPVEPLAMQQDTLQHAHGEESVESSRPPPEARISPFGTVWNVVKRIWPRSSSRS